MLTHCSLFAGIEGFGLAGKWLGWNLKVNVEIDQWCQKVIKKNFPGTEIYGDIKTFNGQKYKGTIDILTGGFPCQPFSSAGKRKGTDDNRFLWPEMFRVCKEIQPTWIVAENVYGLVNMRRGLVLEQVCTEMEAEGYQTQPIIIPACAVNAPHRRDRVWIVAYSVGNGHKRKNRSKQDRPAQRSCKSKKDKWEWIRDDIRRNGTKGIVTDPGSINDWNIWPTVSPICRGNDGLSKRVEQIDQYGNAIVPQVFFEIGKVINIMHKQFYHEH